MVEEIASLCLPRLNSQRAGHSGRFNKCLCWIATMRDALWPSVRSAVVVILARWWKWPASSVALSLSNARKCNEIKEVAPVGQQSHWMTGMGQSYIIGRYWLLYLCKMDVYWMIWFCPSTDNRELPQVINGTNSEYPSLSDTVKIEQSEACGRYGVAKSTISVGDVIAVERPYAFVMNPIKFKTHCHHCFRAWVLCAYQLVPLWYSYVRTWLLNENLLWNSWLK